MTETELFTIKINEKSAHALQINLPEGVCSHYPMLCSLLYLNKTNSIATQLAGILSEADFWFEYIWQPLLENEPLPSLWAFPPELIQTMAIALELQALRLLIDYCVKYESFLTVTVSSTKKPISFGILNDIEDEISQLDPAIVEQYKNYVKITDVHLTSRPSFNSFDSIRHNDESSRSLLALWLNDRDYFNNKCSDNSFYKIIFSYGQTKDRDLLKNLSTYKEKHYIYALYNLNDMIINNHTYNKIPISPDSLEIDLLRVYAHIKCSLPFSSTDLDRLIKKCNSNNLKYWHAYLLTYGHIVRSYDPNSSFGAISSQLNSAFIEFKKLGDLVGLTRVYHSKAMLLLKNDNFKQAKRLLSICINIRQFLQDSFGVAKILNGMAFIYTQHDDFDNAISAHKNALTHLENVSQWGEVALTCNSISWIYLLMSDYQQSVDYGLKTLETMTNYQLQNIPFRTYPDIYAQLGLSYFYLGDFDNALIQSDKCEKQKIDSSSTGEILRTLLRALIYDHRDDPYLADMGFQYLPELIEGYSDIDIHFTPILYRSMAARFAKAHDEWSSHTYRQKGLKYCKTHKLVHTEKWFQP